MAKSDPSPGIQVNIHEAKTNFSKIIQRVIAGETVSIAKSGRPVAHIVPVNPAAPRRVPGEDAGQGWIAEDFDAPLPEEVLRDFEA